MEVLFVIFVVMCYLTLFGMMIAAAAMHMWFAFAGWLVAWFLATLIAIGGAMNR